MFEYFARRRSSSRERLQRLNSFKRDLESKFSPTRRSCSCKALIISHRLFIQRVSNFEKFHGMQKSVLKAAIEELFNYVIPSNLEKFRQTIIKTKTSLRGWR